jgi:glucose-1-phosphate thymidylyltransferase
MKGIVLAGGTGSRLWPITQSVSKQLLPVYDKPMIYYPISTLMLAGVREILVITTPDDHSSFKKLLGDGSQFGIRILFETQKAPEGLAQALLIGKDFLNGDPCMLILGDNIFHGTGLGQELKNIIPRGGCHIFTYEVSNPSEYGILTLDKSGVPLSIQEKPVSNTSRLAITGMYYFDNKASEFASKVTPSNRGELEITAVLEQYLDRQELTFTHLSRGSTWLDTGNPMSLSDAANYIRVIEERTGLKIACLEEIALLNGWISWEMLRSLPSLSANNDYSRYLKKLSSNN